MKKIYVWFVVLAVFFKVNYAQQQPFPEEPAAFVKEVVKYMNAVKREDLNATATEFEQLYAGGKIPEEHIAIMVKTANLMLERSMRQYPYFEMYFRAVNRYFSADKQYVPFEQWGQVVYDLTASQKRGQNTPFKDLLEFSINLFEKGAIYSTANREWFTTADRCEFQFGEGNVRVMFPECDLFAITVGDTITISRTKGVYLPLEQKWEGSGGIVDWTRAGFNRDDVYCTLKNYTVETPKSLYTADSVSFWFKLFFDFPLTGSIEDKLITKNKKGSSTYPRFYSYNQDITIDNLGENTSYRGGFALIGSKITGTGTPENPARLFFKLDDGTRAARAKSQEILIRKPVEIDAIDAAVTIYLKNDSIFHPSLKLNYRIPEKILTLYRGDRGVGLSKFYDSYHQQEFEADVLRWDFNANTIEIKNLTTAGQKPVVFYSTNYFRKGELDKFQGIMDFNPVYKLKQYAERTGTRTFYADDFAKFMNQNYSENTIKRLLYSLVENGFVDYDEGNGIITVRPKVFRYIMANEDAIDYDIIKTESYSRDVNGILNLEDLSIQLQGVNQITVSDSQSVYIKPAEGKVKLMGNHDMEFSGIVEAGRIDFEGTGFYFDYDSFTIDLTELAAAQMYVPTKERDEKGYYLLKPLKSKIEGLTGILEIDDPNNKSSKKKYPEYPIYTNYKESYVYYCKEEIFDSAYSRDRFYFELVPFRFDSLDNFDPYLSDFQGKLVSADIFPDFPERLKIQKDLSFGFKRVTPPEGFPLYKGIATYRDSIMLSNQGLRGKGRVNYLFTHWRSRDIVFLPDSMLAHADSFYMEETIYKGVGFPLVKGKNNYIRWYPYRDTMLIAMKKDPFIMYDIEARMKGNLLFTTKGLTGDGSFVWKEAALTSNQFKFSDNELDADTLSMEILSIASDKVTFNTPNVRAHIDFDKQIGEFKSNIKGIPTEFSSNQYTTNINEFFWDMQRNVLEFRSPPGQPEYFVSTNPAQKGLKFKGEKALFDLPTSTLKVEGIPYIQVADSRVIPDSGKVVIHENAVMDKLQNAVITGDTVNNYHRIYQAEVSIISRDSLKGRGKYDYVNRAGETFPVYFDTLTTHTITESRKKQSHIITARGTVVEEDRFKIDPLAYFSGDIRLRTPDQFLDFNGYIKLDIDSNIKKTNWITFYEQVDPQHFQVRYHDPLTKTGDTAIVGFTFNVRDSISLKSYIFNKPSSLTDHIMFKANGLMVYDPVKEEFRFGDEGRVTEDKMRGNLFTLNLKEKTIKGNGVFDLGLQFKPFEHFAAGTLTERLDSTSFEFRFGILAMNLLLEEELLEMMGKDLLEFNADKPDIDYNTTNFTAALANAVEEKSVDKTIKALNTTGVFQKPKELGNFELVFSNLRMVYDPSNQTYRSVGPIGLSYVGENAIHKKVNGWVEFGFRRSGDFFNMYFESNLYDWYFISYRHNTLEIISSNEDFVKLLGAIPVENRTFIISEANEETGEMEELYIYTLGTYKDMKQFVNRMKTYEKQQ